MDKEGKKIKKLYDNYLALKELVESNSFLTEDGILVELELVRAERDKRESRYIQLENI